jgi:patatin-like phospholipase
LQQWSCIAVTGYAPPLVYLLESVMRCCIIRTTLVSLLVVVSFVFGFSQAARTVARPKVGSVLEGGGTLGLAHIGVLQWLEEHRIPVNYIAGTSMGGLVGGIYATGHSAVDASRMPQNTQVIWSSASERDWSSPKDSIPARKS